MSGGGGIYFITIFSSIWMAVYPLAVTIDAPANTPRG